MLYCTTAGVQLGSIPDSPLLKSLALISTAEQNASEKTTAEAGEADKVKGPDKAADSNPSLWAATVAIAPGIPSLPRKLVQKVLNGEYVNFTKLLPAKQRTKPISLDWEGQVLLIQSADLYSTKKADPRLSYLGAVFRNLPV